MKEMKIEDHGPIAECNHPTLGYFQWVDSFWSRSIKFPAKAFEGASVTIRCRAAKKKIPDSLLQDPDLLQDSFGQWWPLVEERIKGIIEKKKLDCPPELRIKSLVAGLKKESIANGAKWNFELETDPFYVFEGRMEGLTCTKLSRLNVH